MSTQEGQVKITLPDGSERQYPRAVWQEMLENIQSECDDHFESGPTNLKEAYTSFLQIGLNGAQNVGVSQAQQRSGAKSS